MKKNIIAILLVLVVLFGGYYLMSSKNTPVDEMVQQSNNTDVSGLEGADTMDVNSSQKVLNVIANESKATYEIDEVLRGTPTLVVGNSGALGGTVSLNQETKKIESAKITLDANTLKTDIDMRDNNVRNMVLKTNEPGNEAITFVMSSIEGAPEASLDTDVTVRIMGDLTISGVTKPVSFDGTAKMSADGALSVNASTVLTYEDFGIAVPNLSFLSGVSKTVKLTVAIVAR